jgi:hypothetical protein
MSDFRLSEVAFLAGKDQRTIREWCKRGLIKGAYVRGGARGHWRIRANSLPEAADQALEAAKDFSRNRGKHWQTSFRRFAKRASRVQRLAKRLCLPMEATRRAAISTRRKLRPATRSLQLLLEVSDDRLARVGWSRKMLKQMVSRLMPRTTAKELIQAALILSMLEEYEDSRTDPDRARAAIARRFGMDRRTFNRDFGPHWNAAATAFSLFLGVGLAPDSAMDYTGETDAKPMRTPIEMPPHATPQELRIFRAG